MPRGPRLDAPGVLHHVMVRGLERRALFRDDRDRADFLRRVGAVAARRALTVYAWALLPNNVHLLVRTGTRPLARSMRSLLTGYAGAFNRRHHRAGHLFQNRYKSIVVEEEPYLLELTRYIHLNPLRAGRDQPSQAIKEVGPIAVVAEDGATLEPPHHDMVEDPGGIESRAARHGDTLTQSY